MTERLKSLETEIVASAASDPESAYRRIDRLTDDFAAAAQRASGPLDAEFRFTA